MAEPHLQVPVAMTIAGSDSGGGAGIQADLKAFAACGVHGTSAITALTAQSTTGVTAVHPVPPEMIVEQVATVAADMRIAAVKIGMLGTAGTVAAVEEALDLLPVEVPIVIDPVMVAESGAVLLDADARSALRERLLPRATVITPNVPEARVLAEDADAEADVEALAQRLHALGPRYVVVTGGHREEATDVFYDGREVTLVPGERHPDGAAHGSGCTHSSALAAHLALGLTAVEAARQAKDVASSAVRDGLRHVGRGAGPVDVFGLLRRPARHRPSSAGAPGGGDAAGDRGVQSPRDGGRALS